MTTQTSQTGIDLIKIEEGLRLKAYTDSAGYGTIGYGHKILPNENLTVISQEKAEQLFANDLALAESAVNHYVITPINQPQFDALVDFVFNLGAENFKKSTLLRLINDEQYLLAADEFTKWDHCDGQTDEGLLRRREAEKQLFLQGC